MAEPSIFIGVVSYVGTRYARNQSDQGLGAQLGTALREHGSTVSVAVDTDNRWVHDPAALTSERVQAALTAQQKLEDTWIAYLRAGRPRGARHVGESALRWSRRIFRRVFEPDSQFLVRLLNIELAHRALLKQGIASGADWVVILEDDAASSDVVELAEGLVTFFNEVSSDVQFVNLSESFDIHELGVAHLLTPSAIRWHKSSGRSVLLAERPVTNTVCAIAYRAGFAASLLKAFDDLGLFPVVPIDWRLNQALMAMFYQGELGAGSCAWVVPGPIDQLSMRES